MDIDEERNFADQGPLTDMDREEDAEIILSLLLKHTPSCIDAADIEQLVQDIPVQPPVVVPARTVQEAVAAGDLPPLDADAANVFSRSERIMQDHFRRHNTNAAELKDLIQRVLHHPDVWMWRYGRGRPQMVSIAEAERIRAGRLSESRSSAGPGRQRRGSVAARPLPQLGRRKAAAEQIEHKPMLS